MKEDTPATGIQTQPGETGKPKESESPFLGTYKTKDDAERGVREKDNEIARLHNELHSRKALEGLASKVEQLATTKNGKEDADRERAEQQARLTQLEDEISQALAADEKTAARKLLEINSAYAADVESRSSKKLEQELKRIRDEQAEAVAQLREQMQEIEPDRVQHREAVARLAEKYGLDPKKDREVLLKIAKTDSTTTRPGRVALPGSNGVTHESVETEEDVLSDDEAAILAGAGITVTPAEKAKLKQQYARR